MSASLPRQASHPKCRAAGDAAPASPNLAALVARYRAATGENPRTTDPAELARAVARHESENARRAAYEAQSDPLFFEWQRGDGTEQAWLDAVAAVKAANPYPPAP